MKTILLFFILIFFTSVRPASRPCDNNPHTPLPPCAVPIDKGLEFLIIAAIGLGLKKTYKNKNQTI